MKNVLLSLLMVLSLVIGSWSLCIGYSYAAIPQRMNYQGKLTDADGKLVSDGNYDMIFSIYDAVTDGNQEWTETWDTGTTQVQVTNGLFNVLLGTHTTLNIAFDEDYWLQLEVKYDASYQTLLPRQQIVSAGYAYKAEKVTDGAITNASLDATAAVDGTKISPDFGSQNVVTGGDITAATFNTDISATELGYLDGVSSAIQTQLDAKALTASPTFTGDVTMPGTGIWNTSGNVGIGTASPDSKLQVVTAGELEVASVSGAGRYKIALGISSSYGWIDSYHVGTGSVPLSINPNGGKVGIGTGVPDQKLDVRGNIFLGIGQTNPTLYLGEGTGANQYSLFRWNNANNFIGMGDVGHPDTFVIKSGNVGIGTTGPSVNLEIAHATNPKIYLTTTGGAQTILSAAMGGSYFGSMNNYPSYLVANGSTKMTVLSSGNVGIGTTSPSTNLQMGDGTGTKGIAILGANTQTHSGRLSFFEAAYETAGIEFSYDSENNRLNLWDWASSARGTTPIMTWTRIGNNVGIGTASPNASLHVASGRIQVTGNNAPSGGAGVEIGWDGSSEGSIIAYDRSASAMQNLNLGDTVYILNTGNVGIGTTTPGAKLHINSSSESIENFIILHNPNNYHAGIAYKGFNWAGSADDLTAAIRFGVHNTGNDDGEISFFTASNINAAGTLEEQMRIDQYGNVGIGTTSPSVDLEVAGQIKINRASSNSMSLWFNNADVEGDWYVDAYQGNFRICEWEPTNQNRLVITPGGNVGIGTTETGGVKLRVEGGSQVGVFGISSSNFGVWGKSTSATGVYASSSSGKGVWATSNTGWAGYFIGDVYISDNVGIGTTSPGGKLDVNGTIYQRGVQIHADYVFEPEYELEAIEENAEFMWREKHLKAIPKLTFDVNGNEVREIGADRRGIVEELEKAHIYIEQLHERLSKLECWRNGEKDD